MEFGGWDLSELKGCNLPQKVASAFIAATDGVVGASYEPVLYVGKKLVSGVNYCILAAQTLATADASKRLVKMIINEAPNGTVKMVSIKKVEL